MTPLFKETTVIKLLATEVNNSFTQQQKEKLYFFIGTSDIVDYIGIKLLAKNIKKYLLDENYLIKHGQVLNVLAKSYGFSNHHSMTASFEEPTKKFEGTTNLSKIFQVRNELFELFDKLNINFQVLYFINRGLEFILAYDFKKIPKEPNIPHKIIEYRKKYASYKYQAKLQINKLVKNYGLKPLKNTLPLIKLSHKRGIDAYEFRNIVVQEYRNFFNPQWIKGGDVKPGNVAPIGRDGYIFVAYDNISFKYDTLRIDSYESDLQWHEINNFLTFLLRYGEVEDYVFVENILKQKKTRPLLNKDTLAKKLLLKKYEKFKFTEDFMYEYERVHSKSLTNILESVRLVVTLSKEDMVLLNKYAEDVSDVIPYHGFMYNLSKLLMKCCIENFNIKDRYREIEKNLYLEFLHYDENKIAISRSENRNQDNILITRLAQLVEIMCQRIEAIIEENSLKIEDIDDIEI